MAFKWVPSYAGIGEIMRSEEVRHALRDHADQLLPRAQQLARDAGLDDFADTMIVEEGTRPRGRPYARVVADDPRGDAFEYGDSDTDRRRILGRAANTQINLR